MVEKKLEFILTEHNPPEVDKQLIFFHSEEIQFSLEKEVEISDWIKKVIILENNTLGVINYVFCSDKYLLKLNQDYLNHDNYTDVITFNYVADSVISGDIFISVDRVTDNASQNQITLTTELHRVMIHGVLHLIGYNDKTTEEAQEIRDKEDYYLTLLSQN